MNNLKPVLTVLGSDPFDEREGARATPEDWKKLNALPKGAKLYAIPDTHRVVSVELLEWAFDLIEQAYNDEIAKGIRAIIDNKEQS